ncbi:hypothetical protein GCM10007216_06160 [Thalassobacillus devorans]|uniref:Uncharacterized protein n=1 Tax=Thalassobacillus devorans TaxID=279813 RepID=A0ABQ1NIX4_9BACI|nr:hypothetical protein GCM10007216_06160 [Thalassobacillus devorans]
MYLYYNQKKTTTQPIDQTANSCVKSEDGGIREEPVRVRSELAGATYNLKQNYGKNI